MEFAASQSNMDRMAQEMQQQNPEAGAVNAQGGYDLPPLPSAPTVPTEMPKVDSKVLKLATVAMLLRKLNQDKVQTILNYQFPLYGLNNFNNIDRFFLPSFSLKYSSFNPSYKINVRKCLFVLFYI